MKKEPYCINYFLIDPYNAIAEIKDGVTRYYRHRNVGVTTDYPSTEFKNFAAFKRHIFF